MYATDVISLQILLNHCLDLLLLLLIFSRVPNSKGMQIPWDISALRAPETSELAALIALMPIFSRSSTWTLLGKYKAPFPGRIPISLPSGTLLSWKKDADDSVSRLEDENEEKLDERMRKEYGSTGAACMLSITRSLVFIRPSGHPFDVSLSSAAMMPVFYSSGLMEWNERRRRC